MKTSTKSVLSDETAFKPEEDTPVAWRSLIGDVLDFIAEEHQTGTLTVHFRPGGAITALVFKEATTIPQHQRALMSEPNEK